MRSNNEIQQQLKYRLYSDKDLLKLQMRDDASNFTSTFKLIKKVKL